MKIIVIAIALCTGCFGAFSPKHPTRKAPLPQRDESYREELARAASALTPAEFDRLFRENARNYGELSGVTGVDRLRYPETAHASAAFAYVRIGIGAEAAGRTGAAARAYWAALGLSSRTLASRRQREEIRQAAYAGLARVAHRKQQREWAALLALCSELAATYVASPQAGEQHDELYDVLDDQVRAQRRIEAEQARANRGVFLQQLSAGLSAVSAGSQLAAGNTAGFSRHMGTALTTSMRANRQSQEAAAAVSQAMTELGGRIGKLRDIAVEDVPDIEAGKDFVSRQVAWYLATATDALPYVKGPLARYTSTRPPLDHRLRAYEAALAAGPRSAATLSSLQALALGVLEAERHVASFERFRVLPGPSYLTSVCGSQHDVACHFAAVDVCSAGIGEGCDMLAILHGGAP